jgi:hypothetical protein
MAGTDLSFKRDSIPWPDNTTAVFRPTGTMTHLAWIPRTVDQWDCYAEGYREAAERLYESWCRDQHHYLAFPMVFLYRQYTELRLKAESSLLNTFRWRRPHCNLCSEEMP